MKKILLVALVLSSFSVFADHHEENFAEAKSKLIAHLDARIAHINKAKDCVNAATTQEALKACRQQMHAEGKAMKDQWKGEKEAWKAEKKSKRDAAKAAKQKK